MGDDQHQRLIAELLRIAGWAALLWWLNRSSRLEFDRQLGELRGVLEVDRLEQHYRDS